MKKGYYIYVENCGSTGVKRKIAWQIEAFSNWFDMKELMIKTSKRTLIRRILGLLFWNSFARDYAAALEELDKPDFVYIRRTYADKLYLAFLSDIKTIYPECKVIVEVPTYPYKKEMLSSWYTAFMYFKEILYKYKYKDYIDRFVTYSDVDEILGVPTVRTTNGVNVKSITPIDAVDEYNPNKVHLIAVALLARHHGYERVITGLHEYYSVEQKRKVYFHIVGEGPESKKYRKLVKKYNLENYVIFYGTRMDEELDRIYNIADAGLAAFGSYKDGCSKLSTIKAREYLAKGLPVILGAEDDLFLEGKKYGLSFPNTSSFVEIHKIIDYLDELYLNKGKQIINKEIRDYAYQFADNKVTLLPIVNYINIDKDVKEG